MTFRRFFEQQINTKNMEQSIIERFSKVVGAMNVVADSRELSKAEATNYRTDEKVSLIVRPGSTEEVSNCMRIADESGLAVYPVSKGKNWGYGSRVPLTNGSVLMELSRLNKIIEHNDKYGYVTLEAGVTFKQLFDHLRSHNSDLIMSATGGGIESSVVGNAIERGIGTGLYADRFSTVCAIEAVLPGGQIVNTGFSRFDGDPQVAKLYKWGLGPSVDGLFSQSNMGVVTKVTTWMMKAPEHMHILFYKVNDNDKMCSLMNVLRELSMEGLVRPTITIYNDFRVFSTLHQYPFDTCTPGKNNYKEVMAAIRSTSPINATVAQWNGEISIRAVTHEFGMMQYELIKERIKDYVDHVDVVSVTKAEIMEHLQNEYKGDFKGHGQDLIKSFLVRKYIGIPDNLPLRQAYFRKRTPVPEVLDLDGDRCGLLWISPMVPFSGEDVQRAVQIISEVADKYYFEPAISLQCMTERSINIIGSICWDRDVPEEDEMAEKCYAEMVTELKKMGYYAYRNTTMGMRKKSYSSGADNSGYEYFIKAIKSAIDPKHILAAGRYNID
jgi:4-cresol dehydrogenase (hydroxylating) flavoprotein subunit